MNYCEACGSRLVETSRLSHYDQQWGSPRYVFTRQCPKRRWWNGRHDKVTAVARDAEEAARLPDYAWHPGWD